MSGPDLALAARIAELNGADAITRVVMILRPEAAAEPLRSAIVTDPRPPAIVILAAVEWAKRDDLRHPNAIHTLTPAGTTPKVLAEPCDHGYPATDGRGNACRACTPPTPMPDELRALAEELRHKPTQEDA